MFAQVQLEQETSALFARLMDAFERAGLVDAGLARVEREADAFRLILLAARIPRRFTRARVLRDAPLRWRVRRAARPLRADIAALQRAPEAPWLTEDDVMRRLLGRL